MADAACLSCIPPGLQQAIIISLLDTVAGGSSGTNAVSCGSGAPTSTPTSGCAFYIDTDTDAVYIYRSGAWVLKV